MEDQFDFQIDFDYMSSIPVPGTLEESPDSEYIETELNGKKLFMCTAPDCGKAFRYLSQFNRHSIIHKKDRPYQCTFHGCNKTFKRADTLENHMQLHTDDLPYACDKPGCGRKFASQPALRYHKIKHMDNRSFKCEVEGCGKSFLLATQLKHHEATVHATIEPVPQGVSGDKTEDVIINQATTELFPKEVKQLLTDPNNNLQWEIMTQNCKCKENMTAEEAKQSFIKMFGYLMNENKILKEHMRKDKEPKKSTQFIYDHNVGPMDGAFSDLGRLSKFFSSEELQLLEDLREKADNKV